MEDYTKEIVNGVTYFIVPIKKNDDERFNVYQIVGDTTPEFLVGKLRKTFPQYARLSDRILVKRFEAEGVYGYLFKHDINRATFDKYIDKEKNKVKK